MYTEEDLKQNPRMAALVRKAIAKEDRSSLKLLTYDQVINDIPQNKYHVSAKEDRTDANGELFASKREMERYYYLLSFQKAGQIKDLRKQVPYMLQEKFIHPQYGPIQHIMYVADFVYMNVSFRKEYPNRIIVEDSKGGVRTAEYRNKRKNFLKLYPELLFFEV